MSMEFDPTDLRERDGEFWLLVDSDTDLAEFVE